MPVSNDDDTGTVATVGRPRPTLTIETYALYSSGITAAAFALELARCGRSPVGLIGLTAALLTFGLLAFDLGRRGGKRGGVKTTRSLVAYSSGESSSKPVDFSAYDFGPFLKLEVGQTEPLPPDFGADCVVVFYDSTGTCVETWITGVANANCSVRYVNNPSKNSANDPDHICVSP
ncbi:MAG TPA: hypothetical protein VGS22_04845 [Thermoanaerobaculia bacterium]|jgi:hypothetical protein|nr:hypothetical protein [Thermoanaerobaculia bacterium]